MRLFSIIVAGLGLMQHASRSHQVSFSELVLGDEMRVTFESRGCFNHDVIEMRFAKEKQIQVSFYDRSPNVEVRRKGSKPGFMIKLALSEKDIQGLDQLLAFYRSPRPSGCTTVDTIVIEHRRKGKVFAEARFEDGSCGLDRDRPAGIVTFYDLISRARKATKG